MSEERDWYKALRAQGKTRDQAARIVRERSGFWGTASDFGRGLMVGAGKTGTSFTGGIGQILDWAGADETGQRIKDWSQETEDQMVRYYQPGGTAGMLGELGGRVVGEIGATVGTLGAARLGALRHAPKALKAIEKVIDGSRLRSGLAATLAEAPLSGVRAAGEARRGNDFATELAIELGGGFLGGAAMPFKKAGEVVAEDLVGAAADAGDAAASARRSAARQDSGALRINEALEPKVGGDAASFRRQSAASRRGPAPAIDELMLPPSMGGPRPIDELMLPPSREVVEDVVEEVAPEVVEEVVPEVVEDVVEEVVARPPRKPRKPKAPVVEEVVEEVAPEPATANQLGRLLLERDALVESIVARGNGTVSYSKASASSAVKRLDDLIRDARFRNEFPGEPTPNQVVPDRLKVRTGDDGGKEIVTEDGVKYELGQGDTGWEVKRVGKKYPPKKAWSPDPSEGVGGNLDEARAIARESEYERIRGVESPRKSRAGASHPGDANRFYGFPGPIGRAFKSEMGQLVAGGAAGASVGAGVAEANDQSALAGATVGGLVGLGLTDAARGLTASRRAARAAADRPRDLLDEVNIAGVGEVAPPTKGAASFEKTLRSRFMDENIPLLNYVEEFGGGTASRNKLEHLISQSQGHGQAALQKIREDLVPIANSVDMGRLGRYAIMRRELALRAASPDYQPRFPNLSVADLQARVAQGDAEVGLKEGADALEKYFRSLLDLRRKTGIINSKQYDAIVASADYYTPFAKASLDQDSSAISAAGHIVNKSGVQKMAKEAGKEYLKKNPIEVAIEQTIATYRDAGAQRVQNFLAEVMPVGGVEGVIKEIPVGSTASEGAHSFTAFKNGKRVRYEVADRALYDAIAQTADMSNNPIMVLARGMANIKRTGITLLPDFAAMNVMRDAAAYMLQGTFKEVARDGALGAVAGGVAGAAFGNEDIGFIEGALIGAGGGAFVRPAAQIAKSVAEILAHEVGIKDSRVFKEWIANGGSTEGFSVREPGKAVQILREHATFSPSDIIDPRSWVNAMRMIGSAAEQGTRLAAYKRALRDAGDEAGTAEAIAEAVFVSHDVSLRFARKGSATKGWSSVTPFWNAKIQGWDKLYRMLSDKKTLGLGLGTITAPTVSLWMINKDNPEYWDRPLWERNMFWLVPKTLGSDSKEFWRIPKPFEIGYIFASLPERLLDAAAQSGSFGAEIPQAAPPRGGGSELLETAKNFVSGSVTETLPVPTLAETLIQGFTNYDMFRGRPVVPDYMKDLPVEQQVYERTPWLARQAAKLPLGGVSPLKAEKFVEDLAGTSGRRAMSAIDAVMRRTGSDNVPDITEEGREVKDLLGISRFETREYDMGQIEYNAMDQLRSLDSANSGLNRLLRENATDAEIDEYVRRNERDLILYDNMGGIRSQLRQVQDARRAIQRDRQMPVDEKRELLAELDATGQEIARTVLDIVSGN